MASVKDNPPSEETAIAITQFLFDCLMKKDLQVKQNPDTKPKEGDDT